MTDKSTLGVTYLNGWIYIGTKGLKVGSTEEEKAIALGTIAHEICHFAMNLTFENLAQPFKEGDNVKEEEFQAIVEEYDRYLLFFIKDFTCDSLIFLASTNKEI